MWKKGLGLLCALTLCAPLAAGCGGDDDSDEGGGGGSGRSEEEIVIGWTPPDITGVFKTATDYFERAAEDANPTGFDIEMTSRSPATHTAFADQLGIVEDYISQGRRDRGLAGRHRGVKPAIKQANQAGIPVIMVNLLEPQNDIEVASYIGFDNSEAASVSAYSVLDYFGGPGVLGAGERSTSSPTSTSTSRGGRRPTPTPTRTRSRPTAR